MVWEFQNCSVCTGKTAGQCELARKHVIANYGNEYGRTKKSFKEFRNIIACAGINIRMEIVSAYTRSFVDK